MTLRHAVLIGIVAGLVGFACYQASDAWVTSKRTEARQMVLSAYAAGQMSCIQEKSDHGT